MDPMTPRHLLPILLLSVAAAVIAAPPPGHPTPAQARDLLMPEKPATADELPNAGRVISSIDANAFTYIEIDRGDRREWIAAPLIALKPGSEVRYDEGSVMTNFYSKLLKRTFPSVLFVGQVLVIREP
jgi:hypothetical protein